MLETIAIEQEISSEIMAELETTSQEKPKALKKPGRITSKATLVLQTKPAQRLFMNTTGVTEFSKRMAIIWKSAREDDPYADLFLLRVYDALVQARKKLQTLKESYEKLLIGSQEGIKFEVGESSHPMEFPLVFATPYGFMAAYMLADYDKLTRLFLTLRQLGLIDGYFSEVLNEATELVCAVLNKPKEWQFTGVTRQDIKEKNQKAKQAQKLLGKLDAKILEGKLRAPNAPPIQVKNKVQEQ